MKGDQDISELKEIEKLLTETNKAVEEYIRLIEHRKVFYQLKKLGSSGSDQSPK
jgi:hypothetical protein